MLNDIALDDESRHERQLRNNNALRSTRVEGSPRWDSDHHAMEIIPTLEALSIGPEKSLLELGCGDGRFTLLLASRCRWLLGADFAIEPLRLLGQRLRGTRNVGLVLADVATMRVKDAAFDRVLATLVSNLPTRAHRNAMYFLAASALGPGGRFVFSTHHHGIRQWLTGEPRSGRYRPGGIYRYNFSVSECKAEVRPYFRVIKAWPIQIYVPFGRMLGLPVVALSRLLERVPLLNRLGELVLCTAEQRVRADPGVGTA
jgi:SAM-dependent methyltransferase